MAVASLTHVYGAHVIGALALALNLVVRERCPVFDHRLGDGVGEVRGISHRYVALDDRGLRVSAGDDEIARVGNALRRVGIGDEDEVDRQLHDGACRDVYQRPILHERRIERRKGLLFVGGELRQVLREQRLLAFPRLGEAANCDTARQCAECGELAGEPAVYEDECRPFRPVEDERRQVGGSDLRRLGGTGAELALDDRCDAGEVPVLVLRGRKS